MRDLSLFNLSRDVTFQIINAENEPVLISANIIAGKLDRFRKGLIDVIVYGYVGKSSGIYMELPKPVHISIKETSITARQEVKR